MNCLDGDPTTEKELPLIEAASKAGCEYFVIDAGWYAERNENWWDAVGLWQPSKTRFPGGLTDLLSKIKNKGLKPGLWLEIEVAGVNSPLKNKPDSWFMMRHGQRIIDHGRYLLDFRNPEVIAHADEVVDRLTEIYGAEYIKMDYNVTAIMGTESGSESFGQGLLEHNRAVTQWYAKVHEKHPDLVVENCGSGGCRMDYAMLTNTQIQSSSDQTDYRKYPAIVVGALAAVIPEQLAVWSYPLQDGNAKEASFNMVNAMLCRIHQSGHLGNLPKESLDQVTKGIQVYKKSIAPYLSASVPFFPLGMPSMDDKQSPVAAGLKTGNKRFIAAWRLEGSNQVVIPGYVKNEVKLLYPVDLGIKVTKAGEGISITFPDRYMAAIIEID
jgi:alpha-galactosidase